MNVCVVYQNLTSNIGDDFSRACFYSLFQIKIIYQQIATRHVFNHRKIFFVDA
jgi:hypothetical protein